MGASGYTIFEDDLGADWSAGFLANPSTERVARILGQVENESALLDDRQATAALCCAEMVAAALGRPVQTMAADLRPWAESVAANLKHLKDSARRAVEVVKDRSELREIWEGVPEWIAYIDELASRLR